MASSFSTLGIELIATGEASGLWGDKTNVNLQMFQEITSGYVAQSIAGSAQTTALSITNATTGDTARQMIIEFTGTISGNQIVTIPDSLEKMYLVKKQHLEQVLPLVHQTKELNLFLLMEPMLLMQDWVEQLI